MDIHGLSKQVLLVVMDGLGSNPNDLKNAVMHAKKPFLDSCYKNYPYQEINASGELVGLPKGVMGNSEVGHLNLGAGRSIRQDLVIINEAIENKTLSKKEKLNTLIGKTQEAQGRIHLMGLLSDGAVHSHINHIEELIKYISKNSDLEIFFHAFMDGRDTQKDSGINYLKQLEKLSDKFTLASIQGRSIAMDRDNRWERTHQAYKVLTGQVSAVSKTATQYIQSQYDQNIFDEFIEPALLNSKGALKENDSLFFVNFRPDRARQLTFAFNKKDFNKFPIVHKLSYYLCMTPYLAEEMPELNVLFGKETVKGGLSEYLSSLGHKQFKCAETEKYAHVTYFFNGGADSPFDGEIRQLVPSPREVATYDLKPEMNATQVKDHLLNAMDEDYTFFLVNFANPDMVGHTGNFEATIKAIETIDNCLSEIVPKALEKGIAVILTSDHGNSDQMVHEDGAIHTAHTTSLVPFSLIHKDLKNVQLAPKKEILKRALKDVAPTILNLTGIEVPSIFTGTSLF